MIQTYVHILALTTAVCSDLCSILTNNKVNIVLNGKIEHIFGNFAKFKAKSVF